MTGEPREPAPPVSWAVQAVNAAAGVNKEFGHRLMGLPGTWIGAISSPATQRPVPWSEWHYWWQAHYLDAILDAGFAALKRGERTGARRELSRARALLRGIAIRNFGRFPNFYFDDMAWLALAAGRLDLLSRRLTARPSPLARFATWTLTRQLRSAHDGVLGGGLYWSRKRDFKNTPVNGPAALHFARIGDAHTAAAIVDWLRRELFDPVTGLYIDGVHPVPAGPAAPTGRNVEHTVYTYNQGPILAALLELGRPQDLANAAELVEAVRTQLAIPGNGIRLEPGGDGSLFTGILCRHLALAAHDPRLPQQSRDTASNLIQETARQVQDQETRQLSAAVQRWTILSAASR